MTALLLLAFLQAPDDLAGFLAGLEKERAKGATSEDLLKKLDAWAQGKPADVAVRIGWNRGLLEATIKIDELFVEGLKRRVGKPVKLGPHSGTIKEVKADRLVLGVHGGMVEIRFSEVAYDVRLEDIKKENLLPAKSVEEAIFRFAGGRSIAALATARALPEGDDRDRALAAMAGWVLQEIDRTLAAGPTLKAAEEFGTTWAKQPELVAAADGAIRKYIDTVLAPKLVDEADAILEKDRKGARKHLEVAASMCKAEEIAQKISERRWAVLDKNEWMRIPLESLSAMGGKLEGSKIAWEDEEKGMERAATLQVGSLPVSWEEISGVRAKIKPGNCTHVDLRLGVGDPAINHSMTYQAAEPLIFHVKFEERGKEGKTSPPKKITKKADYEFKAERAGNRWKFFIDMTELNTADGGDAVSIVFVVNDGKAELLSLELRKK